YLFTYDGKEYGPCLNIPKALVVYTRGSGFREDSPIPPSFDHQAPYIDFWLRLIGVHEVCSVVVDNAWNQDHTQSEASLAAAKQSVQRMVGGFWGLPQAFPFKGRAVRFSDGLQCPHGCGRCICDVERDPTRDEAGWCAFDLVGASLPRQG